MAMRKVSESYPSRFTKASDFPLGVPIDVRISKVTLEEFEFGPRYCLECTTLDGQPWAEGKGAVIPPGQAKILGFNYGDAPEGWVRHTIKLIPTSFNFKGQAGVTWHVMPTYQPPAADPVPAPSPKPPPPPKEVVAPAANTRPRANNGQAATPPPREAAKRGPGRPPKAKPPAADDALADEIPDFDKP